MFSAVVIIGILFNAARAQYKLWHTQEDIKKLEQEAKKLENDNASILQLIESSLNDPEKIEREARARLNLIKPDEQVIILIPDNDAKSKEGELDNAAGLQHKQSNLSKWWDKFFGDK
ncbi:MAG: hypothetical protein A3A80_00590 [Candidatus Terrybacteria bacterium RIFCSPLOWO2_01_FULL_44_24]|nr:MAG: hypothetical protein A3B75_02300 [Candidatus Terrybacteria bacterium RIFCSPHIGHO2_02_FULL_43_14]OHA51426.1 MAG: hypothetical protein A3A80_00590 [Candidatus Terrybacteria bacterium RIFCSPLOWO2_01_FULL_44_24]